MKTKIFLLALCLLFSACGSYIPKRDLPAPAPGSRVVLTNGEYVSLNKFKDKTLVLAFWQVTCSKSKRLIPKLNELAAQRQDINVVAVSVDKEENFEFFKDYINNNARNLTHAFSGNQGGDEAFLAYGGKGVPLVFIIKNDQIVTITDHYEAIEKELAKP